MLDTIGGRIKEAIKNSGLNQSLVADECGVTKQAVNGWIKKNSIEKTNLLTVSKLTGQNYEWLLTGKGEKSAINYNDNSATKPSADIQESIYGNISDKEKQLILLFRNMDDAEQNHILNTCIFINSQKTEQKKQVNHSST